jgi:hypothetical protein
MYNYRMVVDVHMHSRGAYNHHQKPIGAVCVCMMAIIHTHNTCMCWDGRRFGWKYKNMAMMMMSDDI